MNVQDVRKTPEGQHQLRSKPQDMLSLLTQEWHTRRPGSLELLPVLCKVLGGTHQLVERV